MEANAKEKMFRPLNCLNTLAEVKEYFNEFWGDDVPYFGYKDGFKYDFAPALIGVSHNYRPVYDLNCMNEWLKNHPDFKDKEYYEENLFDYIADDLSLFGNDKTPIFVNMINENGNGTFSENYWKDIQYFETEDEILEYLHKKGYDSTNWFQREYMTAFIGVTIEGEAVADYDEMIRWLANTDDYKNAKYEEWEDSYLAAQEWIDYNPMRALGYSFGGISPVVVYPIAE